MSSITRRPAPRLSSWQTLGIILTVYALFFAAVVQLVLAAIAHAAGSHEHGGEPLFNDHKEFLGLGNAPGSPRAASTPWPEER